MIARFVLLLTMLLYSAWGMDTTHTFVAANKALEELEKLEGNKKGCDENTSVYKRSERSQPIALSKAGIHYNTAFFNIYPSHLAPSLGYITYSKEHSFDAGAFLYKIRGIHEKNIKVYIKARIEVPKAIRSKKVRLYSGEDFRYKGWDGERFIIYNDKPKTQYLRTPLVEVKEDAKHRRYISFVITHFVYTPYELDDSSEIVPDKYIFKIAPNIKGYEKKFRKADVFIVEE